MNERHQKVALIFSYIIYFCFSVSEDVQEPDSLGFFELLEKEKAEAEMAKKLEKEKMYPIAPDGKILSTLNNIFIYILAFVPNSTLRSKFKIKQIEPLDMKMFRLRMVCI